MKTHQVYLLLAIAFCFSYCMAVENKADQNQRGNSRISKVFIQPLDDADSTALKVLKNGIADTFNVEVQLLPFRTMPKKAWYATRKRYWADTLLQWLKPESVKPGEKIIAVTGKDIATTTIRQYNWGVMGLAHQPGTVCVISDYRLHNGKGLAQHRHQKLLKIALHELGHTTGLSHCAVANCFMADADGKDKTDQLTGFCKACSTHIFKH